MHTKINVNLLAILLRAIGTVRDRVATTWAGPWAKVSAEAAILKLSMDLPERADSLVGRFGVCHATIVVSASFLFPVLIVACWVERDQPAIKLFSLLSAIRCRWLPVFNCALNEAFWARSGDTVHIMVLYSNLGNNARTQVSVTVSQ